MTVGNRPQVVNQIIQFHEAGARNIIVVASPSTYTQIDDLLVRCGLNNIAHVVSDKYHQGPVRGIMVGLETSMIEHQLPTYVMFGDTVITEDIPMGGSATGDWVGVGEGEDITRPWCYETPSGTYYDGLIKDPHDRPTIGIYRFKDTIRLHTVISRIIFQNGSTSHNMGMSHFLNSYMTDSSCLFQTWLDVGDIMSLGAARRKRFTTRAHHRLVLDRTSSIIAKTGVSDIEMDFYDSLSKRALDVRSLFPTHYETDRTLRRYVMEYVDLPTLAEYWLYWPGLPSTWADIVQSLINRLMRSLWQSRAGEPNEEFTAGDWMAHKAIDRLNVYKPDHGLEDDILTLGAMIDNDEWVHGHGDLNFTNILFSVNTGAFKLIDPRGGPVPLIYEFGKLAYSHIFAAVTHGLFIKYEDRTWIFPKRKEEIEAINAVLHKYVDPKQLLITVTLILLSAPPMHSEDEADIFFNLGANLMKDILNDGK